MHSRRCILYLALILRLVGYIPFGIGYGSVVEERCDAANALGYPSLVFCLSH